jgi:hypothetical protein
MAFPGREQVTTTQVECPMIAIFLLVVGVGSLGFGVFVGRAQRMRANTARERRLAEIYWWLRIREHELRERPPDR